MHNKGDSKVITKPPELITRTDGRTNGRAPHLPEIALVPDRAGEIERVVIRKRWSYMYGSPGMYWRVSHSSLPAYFQHALHLHSFEDALEYARDVARLASPVSAETPADTAFTAFLTTRDAAVVAAERTAQTGPVFTDRQIEIAEAALAYREAQKASK